MIRNDKRVACGARVLTAALAATLLLPASAGARDAKEGGTDYGIFVKKVEGLTGNFVMGADVSSVIALEKSGVVFRDAAGNARDVFETLADNGINSVRLRVWNRPFDESGKGFGGGNCDIDRAIEIGRRATNSGLWVLLDFHYSDFWADPAKQEAPRAWKDMSVDKKAKALYEYTKDSLERALKAGVDVRMVQIGNETVGAMCGEKNWIAIGKLMREGSRAVREVAKKRGRTIEIAVHFTNPEKDGEYERYARILKKQNVDYDIFASSWYPYWHGTPENLTKALLAASRVSGKKVMCAEVSYAYTYEDGDGFPNTISRETVFPRNWPITPQGQADVVREAIAAVAACGTAGVGVYYWEPAWLPVPGRDRSEREPLWEKYGSGWASRASSEYDADDAGKYFGGTGWDNQAMFSFDGRPLDSLAVWKLARTGAVTSRRPDAADEVTVRVRLGDEISLPEKVTVVMNDGTRESARVRWDAEATDAAPGENYGKTIPLRDIGRRGVGEYALFGTVAGSEKGGAAGRSPVRAFARVFSVEKNYVENPSFEEADLSMWKIENVGGVTTELFVQDKQVDAKSGNRALHFWSSGKVSFRVEQKVTGLAPGTYKFSVTLHGGDAANQDMYVYAKTDGAETREKTNVDGWRNFRTPTIRRIEVRDGTVTVGAYVGCDAKGWGSLDDFILAPVE